MKYNAFNIKIRNKKEKWTQWYIKTLDYKKLVYKILEDIEINRHYQKNPTLKITFYNNYFHKVLKSINIKRKKIKTIENILMKLTPIDIYENSNEIYISTKKYHSCIYKTYLIEGKEMNL